VELFNFGTIRGGTSAGYQHKGGVTFTGVEQFDIFADLIHHVAKRDTLSNIQMNVTYDVASGVTRDDTWWNYEYKMVGTACQQLADRENGFHWHYRFSLGAHGPQARFFLHKDCAFKKITLEYDDTPEITNLAEYDFSGATKPVNTVIAVGEGEGPAALVARKEAATLADTGGRPRYYEVLAFSDIKKVPTLQSHANKHYTHNRMPRQDARVTLVRNPESEFIDFESGNKLNLYIKDHGIKVGKTYRVISRQWVVSKEGDEIVTADLEEMI
jgi:hypothetical protein